MFYCPALLDPGTRSGRYMLWHQKTFEDVIEELNTSLKGISSEEAQKRLTEFGPNELKEKQKKTPLMMFLDQFRDFMIIVLIAAAVISGIVGDLKTRLQ
jgi:Ca2+-transporting ATPase